MYQNLKKISSEISTPLIQAEVFESEDIANKVKTSHIYKRCTFRNTVLKDFNITTSIFQNCIFKDMIIESSTFFLCSFTGSSFLNVRVLDSELMSNGFNRCHFSHVKFEESILNNSRFLKVKVFDVNFSDCNVYQVVFDSMLEFDKNLVFSLCNQEESYFVEA